jgi:hypothetical protein
MTREKLGLFGKISELVLSFAQMYRQYALEIDRQTDVCFHCIP